MTTLRPDPNAVSQITASPPPEPTESPSAPLQLPESSDSVRQKLSIRTLVVASFVVPIVTVVGLTGWLSIRNGQQAVNNLVNRLSDEVTERVENRIQAFADTPYQFLQINSAAVEAGNLNLTDLENMAQYF